MNIGDENDSTWLERPPMLSVFAGARPAWAFISLVTCSLIIPFVIVVVMPGSERRKQAVKSSLAPARITTELRTALDDRSVLIARNSELLIILPVVALMVLKPF